MYADLVKKQQVLDTILAYQKDDRVGSAHGKNSIIIRKSEVHLLKALLVRLRNSMAAAKEQSCPE